jgi:DNA-binding NarL/FixJ family response regulator
MQIADVATSTSDRAEANMNANGNQHTGREGKIRVLLADDHAIISEAFNLILENAGFEVVGTATTGEEAVNLAQELEPDILLLDVVMPEMDGLAALAIIRYMRPEMLIFMLTSYSDKLYLARAGELGANGFFSKSVDPDEIIDVLFEAVEDGASFFSPPSPEEPRRPTQPGFPRPEEQRDLGVDLTDQEMLILSLLALGYDNKGITEQLHISINTLKTHLRNIYEKIEVNDRTQAVIWAIRNGIAPIV